MTVTLPFPTLMLIMTLDEYYQVLDISAGSGMDELKRAFRKKAKQYHPDLNSSEGAQEEFIRVHTAYEMIHAHLVGEDRYELFKELATRFSKQEAEKRRREAIERARGYMRMRYEQYKKETEAYHTSPYSWVFRILYYGLFYLYFFCAFLFVFVPLWAGYEGGVFYFLICIPLFIIAYFTVQMAYGWKREIDPLFN